MRKLDRLAAIAGFRTLRTVLEKRLTPAALAPRHRLIEDEVAELADAIEAIADERDRLAHELKLAQQSGASESPVV